MNNAVLDHLSHPRTKFPRRQRLQDVEITQNQLGLVERPHQVLPRLEVHPHLPSHRAVHLRQQGRGNLNQVNPPQVRGGQETSQIAYHATTKGNHERFPFQAKPGEVIKSLPHLLEIL